MNVKAKRFLRDCKKALSCFMQNPSCRKNKSNITKKEAQKKKRKKKEKKGKGKTRSYFIDGFWKHLTFIF